MRLLIVAAITSALVLAGVSTAAQNTSSTPKAGAAPAGNKENGKRVYISYGCYECHGREAQGGTATGPRLGPRPIVFAAFSLYVRQPSGQMPPYTSKVVSDQDLSDIYAFLQSLPQPPAVKSIPLLNDSK